MAFRKKREAEDIIKKEEHVQDIEEDNEAEDIIKKEEHVQDIEEDNEAEVREIIIEKKVGFNTVEVIIIILIAILFGTLLGGTLVYTKQKVSTTGVSGELKELVTTYNTLLESYYDKVDEKDLLDSAIAGMVSYLDDPYTVFMDEDSTEEFNQTVNGEYVGIGASVTSEDGKATIVSMYDDSPAKAVGIQDGDVITKVNNENVEGLTLTDITSLIKGKDGTKVKITILRGEEEKEFSVTRGTIEIPSVASEVMLKNDKKVGYISVNVFASNTYKQFKKQLKSLEEQQIEALIIDVRSNPGGHLNQVTDILDLFLKKDKVLYQIKTKEKIEKIVATTKSKRSYSIAVLQNAQSASASEILAAAFKDSYKGIIVGTTSYGKGTVQQTQTLSNGSSFKYTTEEWLTPKGHSINEVGIVPTLEVNLSEEYYANPNNDTDNQLQSALEELTKND